MTQKEALEILKQGHNAFVTGAAGSGKTHMLNDYIKYLRKQGVVLGITASTGIAATHMGGTTIHAWSGLGIRDKLSLHDLEDLAEKSYLWKRFEEVKVLIIDEVSMMHHFRLDLIDQILRHFKRNELPFGGLQVIFCGDFFQLPPVGRMGEPPVSFAYESEVWSALDLKICYLEEQWRQKDKNFTFVLNAIRDNKITDKVLELLNDRFDRENTSDREATKLYTHNVDVDIENEKELSKLDGEVFEYEMADKGRDNLTAILKKGCLAPEVLRLKVGARVMFVKNNFEAGYVNGTLGQVIECSYDRVKVKTKAGKIIEVEPTDWKIEEDGKTKASISQLPLRLAWAITVHKSQGMSLDAAEVDLSQSFERGMGYVALSRVRSLDGLFLRGLNETALLVSEEVLARDSEFQIASSQAVAELKKISPEEKDRLEQEFLKRVGADPKKAGKKPKPSTVLETKRLFADGLSLNKICQERGLKLTTIIDHLEKIKKTDSDFDLSRVSNKFSSARLKKIQSALRTSGVEAGGDYLLTPAKIKLGNDFSFEEIRLARLLM